MRRRLEREHTAAQVSTTVVTGAVPQATTTVTAGGNIAVIGPTSGVVQGPSPFVPFPPLLTGSVYKISPEGAPEELWSSRDEVVYSLAVGADGRLLRSEEHTSELQSHVNLVCRLLLENKNNYSILLHTS